MKKFFIGLQLVLTIILIYTVINFKTKESLDEVELFLFPLFTYFGVCLFGVIFSNIYSENRFLISKYILICVLIFALLLIPRFGSIIDIIPLVVLVSVISNWEKKEENIQQISTKEITKREEFFYYFLNFLACASTFAILTLLVISKTEPQYISLSKILLFAGIEMVLFWTLCAYYIFFDREYKYSKTIKTLIVSVSIIIIFLFRNNIFEYSEKIYWVEFLFIIISITIQNIYLRKYKNGKRTNKQYS